jgi:20S proteasome alpha/beta subunit
MEFLETDYRVGLDEQSAIKLGLKALYKQTDPSAATTAGGEPAVDIATVGVKEGYRLLAQDEVKRLVTASQG